VLLRAQNGKRPAFSSAIAIPLPCLCSPEVWGTRFDGLPSSTVFPETSFTVGAIHPRWLQIASPAHSPDLRRFDDPKANTFAILKNQDNGNFVQVTPSPITLRANETGQVAIGTGVFRNDSKKFSTTSPRM